MGSSWRCGGARSDTNVPALPRMGNQHNEMISAALDSMKPPEPTLEEKQIELKIKELLDIQVRAEGQLDELERRVIWAKLAVETKAGAVMASYVNKQALETYERARAEVEQMAGALRFVQSHIPDSALSREIGIVMRPLR